MMSRILKEMLLERAARHAKTGFNHLLDYEAGNKLAITEAVIEASNIPQAMIKLGLDSGYGEGASLSTDKIHSMLGGLQNSHQKQTFIEGFKGEIDQFSRELWTYFENTCLAIEGAGG